jgi:hypothetical protein
MKFKLPSNKDNNNVASAKTEITTEAPGISRIKGFATVAIRSVQEPTDSAKIISG